MTNRDKEKTLTFMDYVQHHERAWGHDTYAGRPDLAAILESPVVILWEPVQPAPAAKNPQPTRFTVTLHTTLDELDDYFSKIIFRSAVEPPKHRVVKIYQDKKPVIVRGVKVVFGKAAE